MNPSFLRCLFAPILACVLVGAAASTDAAPPVITSGPLSRTNLIGTVATFGVTNTGTAPFYYQWYRNSSLITNANYYEIILSNIGPGSAASFYVVITNASGSVTSAVAVLTVVRPPVITNQPVSVTNNAGTATSFSVSGIGGTAPFTYQWRFNGAPLPGANTTTLALTNVQFTNQGNYDVVVSNDYTGVTSAVAVLTVNAAPLITLSPSATNVVNGLDFPLTASAIGSAPLTYQWRKAGVNLADSARIQGATSNVLTIRDATTNDAALYQFVVSNPFGAITSAAAAVTVVMPACVPAQSNLVGWWPVLPGQPVGLDVVSGTVAAPAGGLTNGAGRVGQGFACDVGRTLTAPASARLVVSNLTFEAWVNPATSATNMPVLEYEDSVNYAGAHMWVNIGSPGTLQANLRPFEQGYLDQFIIISAPGVVPANRWSHVALTYDRTSGLAKLYVNAVEVASQSFGTVTPNTTLPLGLGFCPIGPELGSGMTFIGGLDEVAVYARALAPAELAANYQASVSGHCLDLPVITQPPASTTNVVGGTTVLTAAATSLLQPLGYQWQFGGTNLPAPSSNALTLASLTTNSAGSYRVIVSNPAGSVTSAVAVLTIPIPPQVTVPPTNVTAVIGSTVALSGAATGDGPLTFQWLHNGTNFFAGTNTLTLTNLDAGAGGSYQFIVTGAGGTATSAVATVTVVFPPAIATPPLSQLASVGSVVTFSAGVTGTVPFSYQWLFKGAPLGGATNGLLMLNSVGTNEGGTYQLAVANAYGAITSAPASLDVGYPPVFTVPPASQTVGTGDSVLFSAAATGSQPLGYQWYFNGTPLSGETNSSLALANVTTNHTGSYSVVASNAYGTATSIAAPLTVLVTPCANTLPGLVAWWRGEGNGADETGRHPGTFPSGAVFSPGKFAQAFDFVTSSRRMTVTDSPDFQLTNALSLMVWVNLHSYSGLIMFRGDNRAGLDAFSLDAYATEAVKMVLCDQNNNTATVAAPVATNRWQFLAATWERTTGLLKLYVNGQLAAQTTTGVIPSGALDAGSDPAIGIGNHGGSQHQFPFDGLIDEPQIYSRALTDAEILAAYTNSFIAPCSQPPQVTQSPVSTTVIEGAVTNLTVGVVGTPPLAYQWLSNGVPMVEDFSHVGCTTSNLLFYAAGRTDAADYSCLITNLFGRVTSSVATLTVPFLPTIAFLSPAQYGPAAGGYAFTPLVVGSPPLVFQWFKDGNPLPGATNATLSLANLSTNDNGGYLFVVTNTVGSVTSSVVNFTVLNPPVITLSPASQTNFVTSNAVFTVAVTGDAPLTYQWRQNGVAVGDTARRTGTATPTLTLSNLVTGDASDYDCVITNPSASVTSGVAHLTVLAPPAFTVQPVSRILVPGQSNAFTAVVTGNGPITYQWQLNNTDIPGATNTSYSLPAVGTNDFGAYRLVASNLAGATYSADALLVRGNLVIWGNNTSGQTNIPLNATNLIAVVGGGSSYSSGNPTVNNTLGLRADGTLMAWGDTRYSQTNIPANATNVVAIAAGGGHFLALRGDGSVVAWGNNSSGQTTVPSTLSNVIAIAAGDNHSMALRSDGRVFGWGNNSVGQVGGASNVVKITALTCGPNHTLALREDGVLFGWGITNGEQLQTASLGPLPVPGGLFDVAGAAGGYSDSLVVRSNGTVAIWGSTNFNKLLAPSNLTNVTAVAAGNHFSMALRADGSVTVWGRGDFGQTNVPAYASNILSISAGPGHALALLGDGRPLITRPPVGGNSWLGRTYRFTATVTGNGPLSYQWLLNGTNLPGATNLTLVLSNLAATNSGRYQLVASNALGVATSVAVPLVVTGNFISFLAPLPLAYTNYVGGKLWLNAAVAGTGPVTWQWKFNGTNIAGATNEDYILEPLYVTNAGNYSVTASYPVSGPITSLNSSQRVSQLRAWGYTAAEAPPTTTNVIALAPGFYGGSGSSQSEFWALRADGKLTNWGYPFSTASTPPASVTNSTVSAIAAGNGHALALLPGGSVVVWGGIVTVPASATNVTAIACGDSFDLALRSDGTVVGWLGFGSSQITNYPAGLTNIVAICGAAGTRATALRADGKVLAWGDSPLTPPTSLSNVLAIAAGTGNSSFTVALLADGTVTNWSNSKVLNSMDWTNIVAISAGYSHITGLRADGTLVTTGNYYNGQNATLPGALENVISLATGGDHDVVIFGPRSPAITIQSFDRTILRGSNTTFHIRAVSPAPATYQWLFNGSVIPNATNWSLTVTNAQFTNAGAYQLSISNRWGVAVSKAAKLTVSLPLGEALDTVAFPTGPTTNTWLSTGALPWFGQVATTHDGVDAAQSGSITHLQESFLSTVVTNTGPTPGTVSFWWKVSSEFGFDTLEFRVNGAVQATISGEVGWEQRSFNVGTGTNTLVWRYSKDASGSGGQDAGWVDQLSYTPGPPLITAQPVNRSVTEPADVTLAANVSGTGPLFYRWFQNGTNFVSAAGALTFSPVARSNAGVYSLIVSNAGGFAQSSNVTLTVTAPQLLGTPVLGPGGALFFTSTDADGSLPPAELFANFELQASDTLTNWITLTNGLSLTNGLLQVIDADATNHPSRYYRLIEH